MTITDQGGYRVDRNVVLIMLAVLFFGACSVQKPKGEIASAVVEMGLPTVIECPSLPMTPNCAITKPSVPPTSTMLFGDVLAGEFVYKNGGVKIGTDGKIAAVGCMTPASSALVISCPKQIISPGLINPHDHLSYNQNSPGGQNNNNGASNPNYVLCNNPDNAFANPLCEKYRYDRRNEWRKGLNGKPKINAPWGGTDQAKAWNELRHVLVGTTSIAGSGGQIGLARNPDVLALMEGLVTPDKKTVDYDTFPLGDTSNVDGHDYGDCHYPNVAQPSVLGNLIFLPHVAEGINEYAHNELYCLTGRGDGSEALQAKNSTFIHTVAAIPVDSEIIKKADMTLVWSPRSNLSLYGNTAQVTLYDTLGVRLSLSTDWTPSGSINLFRELACAANYNEVYLNGHFSKQHLWQMVTVNAARALGIDDQVGTIAVGQWADIAVYNAIGKGYTSYYDPILKGDVSEVSLVLRAGRPLYGDEAVVMALDNRCEFLSGGVCGNDVAVCVRETGYSFSELKSANDNSYPLFFCGVPEDEPSCVPARYQEYSGKVTALDSDGDGIANVADNCPNVFNPIRPMDNGVQADSNGDGKGDVCDPHPL
jgi:hypothetical protein